MSGRADIVFRSSRTRSRGQVDIAAAAEEPNVTLSPSSGSVTVGGGDIQAPGAIRVRNPASSFDDGTEVLGELSATDGAGSLRLWEQPTNSFRSERIVVDGSTDSIGVRTLRQGEVTTNLGTTDVGGRIELHDTSRQEPVLIGDATGTGAGELRMTDRSGRVTSRALGGEGTLLLSGPPEAPLDEGGEVKTGYGGGELVLEEWQRSGRRDIHVHATGEKVSDYGDDVGNRPRILLDGPEATLELGREELGTERPSVRGEIVLRDDKGTPLLEAKASPFEAGIALFWSDAGGRELRGEIRATPDGLTITDAGGRPALRITPQNEVLTRRAVREF